MFSCVIHTHTQPGNFLEFCFFGRLNVVKFSSLLGVCVCDITSLGMHISSIVVDYSFRVLGVVSAQIIEVFVGILSGIRIFSDLVDIIISWLEPSRNVSRVLCCGLL